MKERFARTLTDMTSKYDELHDLHKSTKAEMNSQINSLSLSSVNHEKYKEELQNKLDNAEM